MHSFRMENMQKRQSDRLTNAKGLDTIYSIGSVKIYYICAFTKVNYTKCGAFPAWSLVCRREVCVLICVQTLEFSPFFGMAGCWSKAS